jgi:mRNA interferase RelE/StbE
MTEPYRLEFTDSARDELANLDRTIARRILKKLSWLAENAASYQHSALAGQWGQHYRLRVGDYRVIYTIDHEVLVILVIKIGHRHEIYED